MERAQKNSRTKLLGGVHCQARNLVQVVGVQERGSGRRSGEVHHPVDLAKPLPLDPKPYTYTLTLAFREVFSAVSVQASVVCCVFGVQCWCTRVGYKVYA